jgi:lysyl-tRNA synthetase, class II
MHLSEQEIVRREHLDAIRAMGIDPYPAAQYHVTDTADSIRNNFDDALLETYKIETVCLAGRLMNVRDMGKAAFVSLQDSTGRIQLYVSSNEICPEEDTEKLYYKNFFKKLLDIGDYVGVTGYKFRTKVGEISIKSLTLLSKCLRPLPIVKIDAEGHKYDEFTDPELRYRMRYVDLTVNPHVKPIFMARIKLMTTMRNFFNNEGWIEVETPILQPIHGGAAARPFKTHHNTLDMPLFLRIANELYLKRLIVGGFDGVYEFGKMFRNEGMDRTHNPEFTAMELYVAYKDYFWMMDMTEKLLQTCAEAVTGSTEVLIGDRTISFASPFQRYTMYESIEKFTGIDVAEMDELGLRDLCKKMHIEIDNTMGRGKLIDEIFGAKVENKLIQPTFITDYPEEMSPLTKKHRSKPGLVERFELFINCKEVANAYTELNDPIDQRARFEEQLALAARGDDEAMMLDEDFLRALEFGMPPTSGIGIGIDRLTMMLTNQSSIQEVLFFPQMRPQRTQEEV